MTDTRQARRALIQKLAADLSDAMQVREGSWTGWNKPSTADLDMQDRFGRRRILDRRARCQEAIGDEVVALRRAVELARKATRCCRDGRHPH